TSGVTFVDMTTPASPRVAGTHPVSGPAWSVALSRGAMYVATELGLAAVANVATPPMINETLWSITPAATATTVSGSSASVTGIMPITVQLKNSVTNATSSIVNVGSDGSWTATVATVAGQALTMTATDAAGRASTRALGTTYGATKTYLANMVTGGTDSYRARRTVSDGNYTVTTTGSLFGGSPRADRVLLFPTASTTGVAQLVSSGVGGIQDVQISNGYLYMAGDRFGSINLADPAFTVHLTGDPNGTDECLAISGRYAFTCEADYQNNGAINIYDINNPGAPVFLRQQLSVLGISGLGYARALVPLGTSYLIGISPERPGAVGHDLIVIDRTDINNLKKVAELEIANFDAIDAVADGSTLYVAGLDAGIAIVDFTNPFVPVLKSTLAVGGPVRGIALSGPNELVVPTGSGITFVDVADKTAPVITGRQKLPGSTIDVDVVGKNILVAAENYFHSIMRP
ncbi:MAG: hypothetical protein ABI837_21550, partial [Acidobacteriota bacterium]